MRRSVLNVKEWYEVRQVGNIEKILSVIHIWRDYRSDGSLLGTGQEVKDSFFGKKESSPGPTFLFLVVGLYDTMDALKKYQLSLTLSSAQVAPFCCPTILRVRGFCPNISKRL